MGRVHLAEDRLEGGQRVALKLYPPGTPAELLRREFIALRGLRHPGIARAYHFGLSEADGAPFFTMEHIAGETLDRFLAPLRDGARRERAAADAPSRSTGRSFGRQASRLFVAQALELLLQASFACGHLHKRGLLHLDLKPGNLLVAGPAPLGDRIGDGSPLLTLIDFGLIRESGTAATVARGTLPFMAPELFAGARADPRADVYALGVAFYLALTGRYPIEAESIDEWAGAHRTRSPAGAPELPRPLERLLLRAMAKEPARRFRSGVELERAVLSLRRALGIAEPEGTRPAVEPELVGREDELLRIERWREGERAAHPLACVSGPDGIGKTRLLETIETSLELAGNQVLWIRPPAQGERSFLVEVMRRLSILYPRQVLGSPAGTAGRLLRHAVGEGAGGAEAESILAITPAEEIRNILRRLARERTAALLREEPVFLLIDDVELADPEGLEFLVDLAAALRAPGTPPRGGIVAAVGSDRSAIGAIRTASRARGAAAVWIPLKPLSPRETRLLSERTASGAPSPRSIEPQDLHRRTGGNPLHVIEELRGSTGDRSPAWGAARIRRAAADRLQEAGGDGWRIAALVASSGRPLPAAVLARASGTSVEATARTLRDLSFRGVFSQGPAGAARFLHHSFGREILERLGREETRDLHRRLAEALIGARIAPAEEEAPRETKTSAQPASLLTQVDIAYHLFHADEPERAASAAEPVSAGVGRLHFAGNERIIEVCERAAEARGTGEPAGRKFLEACGDLQAQAGKFAEARRSFSALAECPEIPPEDRSRFLRKLAAASHRAGDPAQARRLLEQALDGLRRARRAGASAATERLASLTELAILHHFRQETDLARVRARQGLEILSMRRAASKHRAASKARAASKTGAASRDRAGRSDGNEPQFIQRAMDLCSVAGQIAIRALRLDEAAAHLLRGLKFAKAAGATVNSALLLNNLGLTRHLQNRLAEALSDFQRAARIARELGDGAALASIRCNVAQIQAKRGKFAAALADLDRLAGEPAVVQSPRLRLGVIYSQALALSLQGSGSADWESVASLADELGDPFLKSFAEVYRAEAEIERGDWSRARRRLAGDLVPAARRCADARVSFLDAALGRPERRPKSARSARGISERSGAGAGAPLPDLLEAWNRLWLGQADLDAGRLPSARAHFLAGLRFFRTRGIAPGAIEASILLADADLRRAGSAGPGSGGLIESARRWMERARKVATDAPGGIEPRRRALRLQLLEARAALQSALGGDVPHSGAARARDTLAGAGGEEALHGALPLAIEFETLQSALAVLEDDPSAARDAAARLDETRRRLAGLLVSADRRTFLAQDPFRRLGIEDLRPPWKTPWPPGAREALREALACLRPRNEHSAAGGAPWEAALAAIARPFGACAAWVMAEESKGLPCIRASWPVPPQGGARPLPAGLASRLRSLRPFGFASTFRKERGPFLSVPIAGPTGLTGPGRRMLIVEIAGQTGAGGGAGGDAGGMDFLRAAADIFSIAGVERFVAAGDPLSVAGAPRRDGSHDAATREIDRGVVESRTRTLLATERAERAERGKSGERGKRGEQAGLIARSEAARKLAVDIARAAASNLPILITGESGSGKEVVARAIHRLSARGEGPFVSQNCTAIPAGLLEADLFGYERGAFTGADRTRSGYILKARGGTFLLDEIGDADPNIQAKILRVIEDRAVRPVGGRRAVPVDVRFVAVTQKDIAAMSREGTFRPDLFYRLAGLQIHVPPLRERREDIAPLCERFLEEAAGRHLRISPRGRQRLESHPWPGNVRELQTVARRIALVLDPAVDGVRPSDVETALRDHGPPIASGPLPPGLLTSHSYEDVRRALDTERLRALWEEHAGDLARLATELRMSVRTVYRRFEILGLKPKQFRAGR